MEKSIEQLNEYVLDNMATMHQITIDFVEDVYGYFQNEIDCEDIVRIENRRTFIGATSYDIENVLQVINPELKEEIEVLNNLKDILNKMDKEVGRLILAHR